MTTGLPASLSGRFAETAFRWPFRRYQRLAIEAYEQGCAVDNRRANIVMPPGSGKTAVGLEIARRRGNRTLILCPNTAVQSQWLRQWDDFAPQVIAASADTSLSAPLTALTYQSICTFISDDPDLEDRALALWSKRLQEAQGLSPDGAEEKIEQLASAGNDHYAAELARYRRRARQLTARGGEPSELLSLLHPNGRAIIEQMKTTGPWTVVLDECHHLLQMWGYLVRAVVDEIGGETFVLGLTATPPADMDAHSTELYHDLFGTADFEVPTPAVVKEGELAPYQELAYLTQPLAHEADYIAEQHLRFEEMLTRLMDVDFASRPFLDWIRARVEERRSRSGARLSWVRFERDHPELAQATLRFFYHADIELPDEARLGERHRQAPTADDWVALIQDYCLGYLRYSPDPKDADAWEEIRQALPSLGYVLTRQGIRSYVSPVDRVLSLSASKGTAALTILGLEADALGDQLRALILCDYERAGRDVVARLRGVLDPQAGSAALLLHLLVSDPEIARLDPILLTGRTVACSRRTAGSLGRWIEEQVPELRGAVALEPLVQSAGDWSDLVSIRPAHGWWRPRNYVPLITRYVEAGHSRCLVGTRGLLGEGWDAKRINVLIDLTAASTATSVHQMRGRSLRLDPQLPRKVANNWDVVCIDPNHPKGMTDYDRFVRKHHHYYAPTIAGEIESGVSHVHPDLSPYGPPDAAEFAEINTAMLARAADRDTAWERWGIGAPYENQESHTLRIRLGRSPGVPSRRLLRHAEGANSERGIRQRATGIALIAGASGAAGLVLGLEPIGLITAAATLTGGGLWLTRTVGEAVQRLRPSDALEDFAMAVAEALRETQGISPDLGPDAVRVAVQPDGYYRCYLADASEEESRLFAESLDELLAPIAAPRYIIPRYVSQVPRSRLGAAWLAVRRRDRQGWGTTVVYHAVPGWLAVNRTRAAAFGRAWNRYVSGGEPLYWQNPEAQAIITMQRGEDPFDVTSQLRRLWR